MDQNSLKQQFDLLQEQQRQKLKRRNELREKQSTSTKGKSRENDVVPTSSTALKDSLWESDELDNLELKLDDGIHGVDSESEEEDIDNADNVVRQLRDENGRLYKLLKEREEECKIMKRRWQEERKELVGQNMGSETAAKKIIDLSKRNRELSAEVEKERTKSSNLARQVSELERNQVDYTRLQIPKQKLDVVSSVVENEESDIKTLHEKLFHSNNRIAELRIQVDNLKEELKVAHKVISKEVGDGFSVQSLIGGSSNWKGRQQQIIHLQNKVAELQAKLNQPQRPSSGHSSLSSVSSFGMSSASMHEDRYKSLLKKIDLEKKEVADRQQLELENLKKDSQKLKEKHDAAKARNNVLSVELKSLKTQITTLKEKGKHDDELIAALIAEQTNLKEKIVTLKRKEKEEQRNVIYHPNQDELVVKLQQQVKAQERKVAELEAEVKNGHSATSKGSQRAKNGSASKKNNFSSQSLLSESKGQSSKRIEEDIEEYKKKLQEVKCYQQVAEVERDKFYDLVQVLERRIDEANQTCMKVKQDLIESKRKNVKLEKQLEKLQSTNNKSRPGFSGNVRPRGSLKDNTALTTSASASKPQGSNLDIEELETRLGIQMDTNDALKEALDSTLKAKQDDLKFYQDMLEQTKKIFLDGLKEFKQNSS